MIDFFSFLRGTKFWVSEEQEKGMKALQADMQKAGRLTNSNAVWWAFSWFVQKDIDAQKYLVKLMGEHVGRLEDQIKLLQDELREVKSNVESKAEARANRKSKREQSAETQGDAEDA